LRYDKETKYTLKVKTTSDFIEDDDTEHHIEEWSEYEIKQDRSRQVYRDCK